MAYKTGDKISIDLNPREHEIPLKVAARITQVYTFEGGDCVYVRFVIAGILRWTWPWLESVQHEIITNCLEVAREQADTLGVRIPVNPETCFYGNTLWISLE